MFVCGHCQTSRIKNELAVVTYQLVKEHQACGLKGLVFALDTGGYIDVRRLPPVTLVIAIHTLP
jgi:hypothetical protein